MRPPGATGWIGGELKQKRSSSIMREFFLIPSEQEMLVRRQSAANEVSEACLCDNHFERPVPVVQRIEQGTPKA